MEDYKQGKGRTETIVLRKVVVATNIIEGTGSGIGRKRAGRRIY